MWIHRFGGTLMLAVTLLYGIWAYIRIKNKGEVREDWHSLLGKIFTFIVILIPASGAFAFRQTQVGGNHVSIVRLKQCHKVIPIL